MHFFPVIFVSIKSLELERCPIQVTTHKFDSITIINQIINSFFFSLCRMGSNFTMLWWNDAALQKLVRQESPNAGSPR